MSGTSGGAAGGGMGGGPMRVAVLDDFQDVARTTAEWDRLRGRAEVTFFTDNVRGPALVERLRPFDVAVAIRERTRFPRDVLDQLPGLKLIATCGMRNLGIDVAACRERGIPVTGTQGGANPTAPLAFGLILALSRNIVAEDRRVREGLWESRIVGTDVKGKVLGLVGLGKLGTEVARMGQAFGMRTVAWSQNLTQERAAAVGCEALGKLDLFRTADFISLHLILGERSRGTVGRAEIDAMKPSAFLVNTSRAGLLDEPALIDALKAGRIAGAGLDVFEEEPVPGDAPILSAPNTILTPHLGYATRENYDSYFPQMLECIEAWMDGTPIRVLEA